ncbi:hypothetical protein TNCV_678061 [Trichonephila clavipes]|nr:hypothetical protein TNCV_678061 [Trichonephila clavipes]
MMSGRYPPLPQALLFFFSKYNSRNERAEEEGVGRLQSSFANFSANSLLIKQNTSVEEQRSYGDVLFSDGCSRLDFPFMSDNAHSHWAHLAEEFLESERVRRIEWPARIPDLKPIGYIWYALSRATATHLLLQGSSKA